MTKDEALRQAALSVLDVWYWHNPQGTPELNRRMTALLNALAESEAIDTSCQRVEELQGREHEAKAAIKTLGRLGYTYHGGELWKPPLGKAAQQQETAPAGSVGWEDYAHTVERERDYYRNLAKAIRAHGDKDVWFWQGDGWDHLESMVDGMHVVIRAGALRELIAASAQQQKPVVQCTESDVWTWKYCRKNKSCDALEDSI